MQSLDLHCRLLHHKPPANLNKMEHIENFAIFVQSFFNPPPPPPCNVLLICPSDMLSLQ